MALSLAGCSQNEGPLRPFFGQNGKSQGWEWSFGGSGGSFGEPWGSRGRPWGGLGTRSGSLWGPWGSFLGPWGSFLEAWGHFFELGPKSVIFTKTNVFFCFFDDFKGLKGSCLRPGGHQGNHFGGLGGLEERREYKMGLRGTKRG